MDQQRADMYLAANQKYFPQEQLGYIREQLALLPEERFGMVSVLALKDPATLLIISILLGYLGVDRFMLGDTGMGVLKLLTVGACGVLTIMDWFSIQRKTRELNFKNLIALL